jgi:hypothetical protein
MPFGWTKVATPDQLHRVIGDPDKFKDTVAGLVKDTGADVHDILWEKAGGPAYVITKVRPENAGQAKDVLDRVKNALGDTTMLFDTQEIKQHP